MGFRFPKISVSPASIKRNMMYAKMAAKFIPGFGGTIAAALETAERFVPEDTPPTRTPAVFDTSPPPVPQVQYMRAVAQESVDYDDEDY